MTSVFFSGFQFMPAIHNIWGICGRSDWVRTSDLYVPNVALYQAELHSVNLKHRRLCTILGKNATFLFDIYTCKSPIMCHIYIVTQKKVPHVRIAIFEKTKVRQLC